MDEDVKHLLKSMTELGNNLRNESLKNKKRKKLEREWDLKKQELSNYTRKLFMKILSSGPEERKKLGEELITIEKIRRNSNPHIDRSWNPFRIQDVVEKVYKKAQEKKLDTNLEIKKTSNFKIIKQKNEKEKLYFLWLKELAEINPDPKLVRNSNNKSLRGIRLEQNSRILILLEQKLFKTKMKIEDLKEDISSRNSIQHLFSALLFNGIEKTHPEIYHFLLLDGSFSFFRSKHLLLEFKQLENLIDRENEKKGYIKKQYNSFLDKINNFNFKTSKDKEKAVGFLTRYYNIETIKRRIIDLKVIIPNLIIMQQSQKEREFKEELKLKEKQEWVEKFESPIKRLRKWCHEEFEELNMPDFNLTKKKKKKKRKVSFTIMTNHSQFSKDFLIKSFDLDSGPEHCFNLVEYNEREDNYRIRIWDLVGIDDDEYVDLQILRT